MRRKKYSAPRTLTIMIANSHLLAGTNQGPIQGEGRNYDWGD